MRHTGRPLARSGDGPLLTGRATFVADVRFANEVHLRIVRSPVSHGRLRGIDAAAARACPGTVAVWTAADVALPPVGAGGGSGHGLDAHREPVLAAGVVRYVGEPIAAVFAETAAAAEDAADLVVLDVCPMPAALAAAGEPAPDQADDRRSGRRQADDAAVRKTYGDVDAAFSGAAHIVEVRVAIARDGAMAIEPRGLAARWEPWCERLEVFGATGAIHRTRDALAAALDLPSPGVVVEATAPGGSAFDDIAPEELLVAIAARALGRPVRWVEDRREHLLACQGGGIAASARAAVTADATIAAIEATVTIDAGAFVRDGTVRAADILAALVPGPYRVPACRVAVDIRPTNRTPAGSLPGSAAAAATLVRERLVEAIAAATGLDPLEVRRRNFVAPAEMPAPRQVTALGASLALDSGRYQHLVDQAATRFGLAGLRRRAEERRAAGTFVGVGTAFSIDLNGLGRRETARLTVDRSGTVEVVSGAAPAHGGPESAIARIVADVVGVDAAKVRFAAARSDRIDRAVGPYPSGGAALAVSAALHAAETLRETILDGACRLLGLPADRLTVEAGRIREANRRAGTGVSVGDIARSMEPGGPIAEAGAAGLSAEGWSRSEAFAVPYAFTVAVVEIDGMTGLVRVPRAMIAADVGNAVDPRAVEDRLAGDLLRGLSSALFTSLPVSAAGMPMVNTFAEYLMPTAAEAPLVEVLVTGDAPSPTHPLGMKGVGGLGATGIGAAVAAAIDDALGTTGPATSLPIEPGRLRAHIATAPTGRSISRATVVRV